VLPSEGEIIRRATRFGLVLERDADGMYRVIHNGEVECSWANKALADAHFELIRDDLQAATGQDPMAQVRAEQGFRDIIGVRGEATRRRTSHEKDKGGKGGRSGV